MRSINTFATISVLGVLSLFLASTAHASSVTVNGTDVIYAAGTQSAVASMAQGTVPGSILFTPGTSYFIFSTTGAVTLNGLNFNDADGYGAAVSQSSETGYGSISGIIAPNAGSLVGVFVGTGGPSGSAPASLNFTSSGIGTGFASLSPLLDQVFFIGDGLTGHAAGYEQQFFVPTGATALYLGISDAGFYNGSPSAYGDNSGSFNVAYGAVLPPPALPSTVPEPSSYLLLGTGVLGAFNMARRRFAD